MFCTDPVTRTAKKQHRCTYCGKAILKSEPYLTWKSIERGDGWYTSKMHQECHSDFAETGDNEYFPFDNERPKEQLK